MKSNENNLPYSVSAHHQLCRRIFEMLQFIFEALGVGLNLVKAAVQATELVDHHLIF